MAVSEGSAEGLHEACVQALEATAHHLLHRTLELSQRSGTADPVNSPCTPQRVQVRVQVVLQVGHHQCHFPGGTEVAAAELQQ